MTLEAVASQVKERFGGKLSASRVSQIETGYQMKGGQAIAVRPAAPRLAHLASVGGGTPERMESEGERPDVADILREILRSEPPVPPPAPAADPLVMPGVDPADAAAAERIYPGDRAAQALLLGSDLAGLADWLRYRRDRAANGYPDDRREGTAG
jgi:hypothetical protein